MRLNEFKSGHSCQDVYRKSWKINGYISLWLTPDGNNKGNERYICGLIANRKTHEMMIDETDGKSTLRVTTDDIVADDWEEIPHWK